MSDDVFKSPILTPGASLTPINPAFGAMRGHPGNVARGPMGSPGRRALLPTGALSQYSNQAWPVPPNEIADVDIDRNWFSPFQPVTPFGPPYTTWPRTYDYPVGENLQYVSPRFQLFEVLRAIAQSWGLVATIIQTRIDQLMRIPWTIRIKDEPDKKDRRIDEVKDFLECPDGQEDFETWARMVLFDLLVIDAPAVYVRKTVGGKPLEWWCLDGACYSQDTQVLTRRGWLRFGDTNEEDEFATRNQKTKIFEWQKSTYRHERDYVGPMIALRSRAVDLLVSPNHRVLIDRMPREISNNTHGKRGERIIAARELARCKRGAARIPMTSRWKGKEVRKQNFRTINS